MYGAIIGDIAGSTLEFKRKKNYDFQIFLPGSDITDDTIMTIAVARALMQWKQEGGDLHEAMRFYMRDLGRKYPYPLGAYGGNFASWLKSNSKLAYNSCGNGSAMRVSACGLMADSLEAALELAKISSEVTHDHPEGIKGAQATAAAIYLARTGSTKAEIRAYIEENFQYDLSRTCDEIRPGYHHIESCQETVPEAITAFLEGESFEDVIRTAVSLGGDCDTLTCIAGSMAEAFYGVPEELKSECRKRLPDDLLEVLRRFDEILNQ